METKEYEINFTGVKIESIIKKQGGYEGKLIFSKDGLIAELTTRPQTKEWWINKSELVGGEFETLVKSLL